METKEIVMKVDSSDLKKAKNDIADLYDKATTSLDKFIKKEEKYLDLLNQEVNLLKSKKDILTSIREGQGGIIRSSASAYPSNTASSSIRSDTDPFNVFDKPNFIINKEILSILSWFKIKAEVPIDQQKLIEGLRELPPYNGGLNGGNPFNNQNNQKSNDNNNNGSNNNNRNNQNPNNNNNSGGFPFDWKKMLLDFVVGGIKGGIESSMVRSFMGDQRNKDLSYAPTIVGGAIAGGIANMTGIENLKNSMISNPYDLLGLYSSALKDVHLENTEEFVSGMASVAQRKEPALLKYARLKGSSNLYDNNGRHFFDNYQTGDFLGMTPSEVLSKASDYIQSAGGKSVATNEEVRRAMIAQNITGVSDGDISKLYASQRFSTRQGVGASDILATFEKGLQKGGRTLEEIRSTFGEYINLYSDMSQKQLDVAGKVDSDSVMRAIMTVQNTTGAEGKQLNRLVSAVSGQGLAKDEVTSSLLYRHLKSANSEMGYLDLMKANERVRSGNGTKEVIGLMKNIFTGNSETDQINIKAMFPNLSWNDLDKAEKALKKGDEKTFNQIISTAGKTEYSYKESADLLKGSITAINSFKETMTEIVSENFVKEIGKVKESIDENRRAMEITTAVYKAIGQSLLKLGFHLGEAPTSKSKLRYDGVYLESISGRSSIM